MTPTTLLAGSIFLSVALSGVLAYNNAREWGWFLFIAMILSFVLVDMVRLG